MNIFLAQETTGFSDRNIERMENYNICKGIRWGGGREVSGYLKILLNLGALEEL